MTHAALNSVRGSVPGAKTSTAARTSQRVDFLGHGCRDFVAGMMLDAHGHNVEPVGIGDEDDLELVANPGDRTHGVLDLSTWIKARSIMFRCVAIEPIFLHLLLPSRAGICCSRCARSYDRPAIVRA